jgi:hypothetical protein
MDDGLPAGMDCLVSVRGGDGVYSSFLPVSFHGERPKTKLRERTLEAVGVSDEDSPIIYTPSHYRKERIKALGNAIVPQVALEIFRAIEAAVRQSNEWHSQPIEQTDGCADRHSAG